MDLANIRIPASQKEPLRLLLSLDAGAYGALLEALRKVPRAVLPTDVATLIAERVPVPAEALASIVDLLSTLFGLRDDVNSSLEALAQRLAALVVEQRIAPADQTSLLTERLIELLSLESTLGVAIKAPRLLAAHDRPFASAAIYTDIRPVFTPGTLSDPSSAVIIHQLAIDFFGYSGTQSTYFALDSRDLRSLHAVIQRALAKEETLKRLLDSTSLRYLDIPQA
jgi:hypothetical protein